MENAGYAKELDDFLHESLAQDPTLPFWDQYVEVAAAASQTGRDARCSKQSCRTRKMIGSDAKNACAPANPLQGPARGG